MSFKIPLFCLTRSKSAHYTSRPLAAPPSSPLSPAATLLRGEIIFPAASGKTNFPAPHFLRHPALRRHFPPLPSWDVGCTRSDFVCWTLCGFCLLWPIYAQGPLDEIRPCAPASHEGVPNPVAVGKICVGEIPNAGQVIGRMPFAPSKGTQKSIAASDAFLRCLGRT